MLLLPTLPSFTELTQALPPIPILASRTLPLLPLIFSTSVLAISTEWYCHLEPLPKLQNPITGKTLSEIFRKSYTNGAWTFLINLGISIGSSGFLYFALDPKRSSPFVGSGWFTSALTTTGNTTSHHHQHLNLFSSGTNTTNLHPLQTINAFSSPTLPLRRQLYLLTSIFGILHLFPFGLFILPHVLSAARPSSNPSNQAGKGKTETTDVKLALKRWLDVNRIRIWMDVGAAVCSVLALVV